MMPTPKAFHGCFGRLMRDASDSDVWITVDRRKNNRKKAGVLQEILNPNRVLNASFSNSKKTMMHREDAPQVEQASLPKGIRHSVTFKSNKNLNKKSFSSKKPKNSLEQSIKAFSKDLENVIKTQESIQQGLSKTDEQMKKVKKELTDSANLLLLHKGLARHLQQLRTDHNPVISKTKNVIKMQKKYENYINSIDDLRNTVGKLKVQSIKIKEGIGKWKHKQKLSTHLLQEFLNDGESCENSPFDDNDCFEASSSAPTDEDYENYDDYEDAWAPILNPPSSHHQCRIVHHERKRPVKKHYPVYPFQNSGQTMKEHHNVFKKHDMLWTPLL
jgi:hypothetical protein